MSPTPAQRTPIPENSGRRGKDFGPLSDTPLLSSSRNRSPVQGEPGVPSYEAPPIFGEVAGLESAAGAPLIGRLLTSGTGIPLFGAPWVLAANSPLHYGGGKFATLPIYRARAKPTHTRTPPNRCTQGKPRPLAGPLIYRGAVSYFDNQLLEAAPETHRIFTPIAAAGGRRWGVGQIPLPSSPPGHHVARNPTPKLRIHRRKSKTRTHL